MSGFSITRETHIAAPASRVHELIDDFRKWEQWSPWEGVDPELRRTYSGPEKGTGAHYAWSGNRKAGEGSMQNTGSTPDRIDIALSFTKPFKAENAVTLDLRPDDTGTTVSWTMTGERNGIMRAAAKVMNLDNMLGKDFEKGLAQLKVAAEA